MAGVLDDPEVCGFPAGKVKLLTNASASRDAVAYHLSKWLPEQARGAEVAVIYFAGHGMIHRIGNREEGYLLPYDADPDDLVTGGVLISTSTICSGRLASTGRGRLASSGSPSG